MSYPLWQEISFYLSEIDKEKSLFEKQGFNPEAVEGMRKKISDFFDELKGSLEQKLDKNHASLILFALVASIDEDMQRVDYSHPKVRWNPLQKDFQGSYTGGEVFFNTIDHILDNPKVPSIVYEVFYFMLKRGFQGKYRESKTQLLKYIDLLKQKIPVNTPVDRDVHAGPARVQSTRGKTTKGRYYTAAAILFFLTGILLYVFSNWEG
jgi:type IV/VI secretion system ImpK/VasF family protein